MAEAFDYIVIGSGSSGATLAARLAEDPGVSVLVLEAGGSERRPIVSMPLAWFEAMRDPSLNWGYMSQPEPFADDRRIPVPRGKVVGGCASINGMMYSRGVAADYDQWAQMGARGWSHAEVLPYFRRSEAYWGGANAWHGGEGPISVSRHRRDGTVYPALIAAAEAMGYRHLDDFNGANDEGFSAPDFTVHKGRRASPSARMLRPALVQHRNIELRAEALVHRIMLHEGRATGVVFERGGAMHEVEARREVLLSAGTINSPQLLMLSGIGPAAHLAEHGIPVAVDLPGVGQNLQDHASIGIMLAASGPFTFDHELRADRFALSLLRWQLFGAGVAGDLPVGAQGFVRTREGLDRPDLQILASPVAMDAKIWFPGWRKRRGDFFSVSNVLLHPESRGSITLASANPRDKPEIRLNLLATEGDRASFRRFVRFTRRWFATAPANALAKAEILPGKAVETDDEIDAYVRRMVGTAMHPTSSCAMGSGAQAVLDETLRVRGVAGLRVVDCAAMPTIPGGNTNAPAIMLAEKSADMIRGKSAPADH